MYKRQDKLKGQLPIGLVVLKTGVEKDNDTVSKECIKMVRDKIGPVAAFKVAIVIKRLPKTRSGKILRGTIRKIADNVEYKMPPTIDDPTIFPLSRVNAPAKAPNIDSIGVPKNNVKARINAASKGR